MAMPSSGRRKRVAALPKLEAPIRGTKVMPKDQYLLVCSQQFKDIKSSLKTIVDEQKSQSESLLEVREKVFNGFGDKIDATDKDVNQLRKDNEESHKDIKGTLKSLIIVFISGLLTIIAAILMNIFLFNSKVDIDKHLEPIIKMLQENADAIDNQSP